MGISSSLDSPDPDHNVGKAAHELEEACSDIVKTTHRRRLADLIANFRSSPSDQPGKKAATDGHGARAHTHDIAKRPKQETLARPTIDAVLRVPEHSLSELRKIMKKSKVPGDDFFEITKDLEAKLAAHAEEKVKEYDDLRQKAVRHERSLGFDFACAKSPDLIEISANEVLQRLKKSDIALFYETAPKKRGYRGQEHPRFYGDHFLSNVDLIEQTQLFALCRAMPKGAHLHIHFNANLLPGVLLGIAKGMERMFIWSNIPLDRDGAFDLCRIQFSIMGEAAVEEKGIGNLLDKDYQGGSVMQFQKFREAYPCGEEAADSWLQSKLVFQEEEAHNLLQTPEGLVSKVCLSELIPHTDVLCSAWEKFNARTQMMKGLFNYETAYKKYTRQCLDEFVDDNIQYAEIRPNFMWSNQVWKDDGSSRIDNVGIMNLIIGEYEAFQKDHKRLNLKGLKVIYCTPRSFSEEQVGDALMQCFQFKMNKRFSEYIAGKPTFETPTQTPRNPRN
jgi:adenosine deaminase CECR1